MKLTKTFGNKQIDLLQTLLIIILVSGRDGAGNSLIELINFVLRFCQTAITAPAFVTGARWHCCGHNQPAKPLSHNTHLHCLPQRCPLLIQLAGS